MSIPCLIAENLFAFIRKRLMLTAIWQFNSIQYNLFWRSCNNVFWYSLPWVTRFNLERFFSSLNLTRGNRVQRIQIKEKDEIYTRRIKQINFPSPRYLFVSLWWCLPFRFSSESTILFLGKLSDSVGRLEKCLLMSVHIKIIIAYRKWLFSVSVSR